MSDIDLDTLESRESGDKIIRGGSLRIGSYIIALLVGLLSAPLLVRHLGVSDYGLFVTANSIIFVVAGLVEGGLASVAVREYTTASKTVRRELLEALLGLRFVLTGIGSATPGRLKRTLTLDPGVPCSTSDTWRIFQPRTTVVSIPTMRSPSRMPARSAGVLGNTLLTVISVFCSSICMSIRCRWIC